MTACVTIEDYRKKARLTKCPQCREMGVDTVAVGTDESSSCRLCGWHYKNKVLTAIPADDEQ